VSERLINGYVIHVERYLGQDDEGIVYSAWRYGVKNPSGEMVGVGDGFDTSEAAKDAATRTAFLCQKRSEQKVPA